MQDLQSTSKRLLNRTWPISVLNFKSGSEFFLYPNSRYYQKPGDDFAIAKLCNEDAIYKFLFKKNLQGKPYEVEYARGFLDWSELGWKSSEFSEKDDFVEDDIRKKRFQRFLSK